MAFGAPMPCRAVSSNFYKDRITELGDRASQSWGNGNFAIFLLYRVSLVIILGVFTSIACDANNES